MSVLVAIAVALAAMFAVAALAKLRDHDAAAEAMRDFGVPERVARPFGALIPVLELAVAALLCVPSTRRIGAVGALALLAAFTLAITRAWARGERADCHCFGQLHSAPAGPRAIARNMALAALAALVLVREPSVRVTLDAQGWAIVALFALVAAGALFGWRLLAQQGRLLLALEELEARLDGAPAHAPAPSRPGELRPGAPAPEVSLPDPGGSTTTLAELLEPGRPLLLTFVAPGCGPCRKLLPTVGDWQRAHGDRVRFAVLRRAGPDYDGGVREAFGLAEQVFEQGDDAFDSFGVTATPTAVLLDGAGVVAAPYALGPAAIEDLASVALERAPEAATLAIQHHAGLEASR